MKVCVYYANPRKKVLFIDKRPHTFYTIQAFVVYSTRFWLMVQLNFKIFQTCLKRYFIFDSSYVIT